MALTLVSGLEMPIATCIASGLFAISRLFYMLPNRGLGFMTGSLCIVVLAVGALYSSIVLLKDV